MLSQKITHIHLNQRIYLKIALKNLSKQIALKS